MIQRNPRYKVVLAHINDSFSIYGRTEDVLMDYKSVEMMLRLTDPVKSVEWCDIILNLRRHAFYTIQLFCNDEFGNKIMKLLKIERN